MKTKKPYIYAVLITVLLSACVPIQAPDPTPTQALLPTAPPIIEPTGDSPTTTDPMPGEVSGPEVVQLGDLTMEVYERIKIRPTDSYDFVTTFGPSSEILKTRRPLRDVFAQPFSPPPVNGHQLTAAEKIVDEKNARGR
jgi:ABC-type transport system substrate-binding protein